MADALIPDKPALEGLEAKWDDAWTAHRTKAFDRARAATERAARGHRSRRAHGGDRHADGRPGGGRSRRAHNFAQRD